jgi:hypothetical protein
MLIGLKMDIKKTFLVHLFHIPLLSGRYWFLKVVVNVKYFSVNTRGYGITTGSDCKSEMFFFDRITNTSISSLKLTYDFKY